MLTALITFLAAEAAGEEASKTPFYVAGAIAAGWAVLVAALGITRHDFPATKGARNAVIAISALVVLSAMATSVATG